MTLEIHVNGPRCPFCREGVSQAAAKVGCPWCMTWLHSECLRELGRCAACGAAPPAAGAAAVPERRIRFARDRGQAPDDMGPELLRLLGRFAGLAMCMFGVVGALSAARGSMDGSADALASMTMFFLGSMLFSRQGRPAGATRP